MNQAPLSIPDSLLLQLDVPGLRYTSYPTADRFVEAFGAEQYSQGLLQRTRGTHVGGGAPMSVYVHVPFCASVCYFCACNKVVTRRHDSARAYLAALRAEIGLHVAMLGRHAAVSQLHLGGGSPTFLTDEELAELMASLQGAFALTPGAEVSIEIDPRTVTPGRLARIRAMGFNRISIGVQDFDPTVQRAVHRVQSLESVRELVLAARTLGFDSVNTDLIYGLPRQTPDSFARTVAQVADLRPDRIALYAYAHQPERFKSQRRIAKADLPLAEQRVRMLGGAIAGFIGRGYVYIGMDHFALPGDALAVAKRQGRLHRNFQGYSTQPEADLIGLGVSAIGRMGASYSQNAFSLPDYHDAVRQGRFPVARGIALTRDDIVRRSVIMALMCQGRVDFESIELAHLVNMRTYFASELEQLRPLANAGLVELGSDMLQVTASGWFYVRGVAMLFDRYLRGDRARARFSRII